MNIMKLDICLQLLIQTVSFFKISPSHQLAPYDNRQIFQEVGNVDLDQWSHSSNLLASWPIGFILSHISPSKSTYISNDFGIRNYLLF